MKKLTLVAIATLMAGLLMQGAQPGFAENEICDDVVSPVGTGTCVINTEKHVSIAAGGTQTVNIDRNLLISEKGSLTIDVPDAGAARSLRINVAGSVTLHAGAVIHASTSDGSRKAANLSISAGGKIVLDNDTTGRGAKILAESRGDCSGGLGGNISLSSAFKPELEAEYSIHVTKNSLVSTSASAVEEEDAPCAAGDISFSATEGRIQIDGVVEAALDDESSERPAGDADGGAISMAAGCELVVSGTVSSRGQANGADRVHLEGGCAVTIDGLVESTADGNARASNSCMGDSRPDKPDALREGGFSAACVEIWSGNTIEVSKGGVVNADVGFSDGTDGVGWIDLLAAGKVTVSGPAIGNSFAVHTNGGKDQKNDNGGVITVKSSLNNVKMTGNALQASSTSQGSQGGKITVQALKDVNLEPNAKVQAKGSKEGDGKAGGYIAMKAFINNILANRETQLDASGGDPAGTIRLTGCSIVEFPEGRFNPGAAIDFDCLGEPSFESYVELPKPVNLEDDFNENCPLCDTDEQGNLIVVRVDGSVVVDFTTAVPTCDDNTLTSDIQDDDICQYFSFEKPSSDPSTWKAIFDLGGKKLIIEDNAVISTVGPKENNNEDAPGIEIKGTCSLVIEGDEDGNKRPGGVTVTSTNEPAGDILLKFNGDITIDGIVRTEVTGTLSRPGEITIASCCGDVKIGEKARIETLGLAGGADINILTTDGDIDIEGQVYAYYKQLSDGGKTPKINIVSYDGAVSIDGTGSFGEDAVAGTKFQRTSGVLILGAESTVPGDIFIQAQDDIVVTGNRIQDKAKLQFGAVAIKTLRNFGETINGAMKVISIGGDIIATDRAFDFENRFNAQSVITLQAAGNIDLGIKLSANHGASNENKSVVSTRATSGGKGGSNVLRAFTGEIIIAEHARVMTDNGTKGNNIQSCIGVNSDDVSILPADEDMTDDIATCDEDAPEAYFESAEVDFGLEFIKGTPKDTGPVVTEFYLPPD